MRVSCCEGKDPKTKPVGKALTGFLEVERHAGWASDGKEAKL